MTKTDPQRLRELRARRHAVRAGYRLEKVPRAGMWRLLYTAAGRPFLPLLAGELEGIERWLAERKRT